jgi:hypothetical protein
MNEQKIKLSEPESQVLLELKKLNDRVGYLIAQQQAILIKLENLEHSMSMLEIEKVNDR